jgi:hypothetical protein
MSDEPVAGWPLIDRSISHAGRRMSGPPEASLREDGATMGRSPEQLAAEDAVAFQDPGVVAAYRYRPPYPAEVFDLLIGLVTTAPRRQRRRGRAWRSTLRMPS